MDSPDVGQLISRAAKSADNAWATSPTTLEDLIQDMWVTVLSDRSYANVIDRGEGPAFVILRRLADRIFSGQGFAEDVARGDRIYSSESIKDALKGTGENPFLREVVPAAVTRLADRHPPYAEALRSRYIDGLIPKSKIGQNALTRAHQALAEEVHAVIVEYDNGDGPGSRAAVFPDSIKATDGHADPTGDAGALLADRGGDLGVDGYTYRQMFDLLNEDEVPVGRGNGHKGIPPNLFDPEFGDLVHADMYRSWVSPELYPNQPQPLLANWSQEDLEMYVGAEWTPGYNRNRKEAA